MRKLWASAIRLLLLLAVAVLLFNAVVVGLHNQAFGIIALLGLTYRLSRKRWSVSGSYGTARVAGLGDLLAGNLLADRGLILGRVGHTARPTQGQAWRSLLSSGMPSEWAVRQCFAAFFGATRSDDFIRIKDFVHLATFAPAGGGKSVSTLVPNLLSYEGNCVVIDPKGELYKLTHKHRQQEFGHTIVRLDPARLYGPGADCFNPFDWIDPNRPEFIDVCRDIANMLVVRTGKEMDPHWCDQRRKRHLCLYRLYLCAGGQPVRTQSAGRAGTARFAGQLHPGAGGDAAA